MSKLLDLADQLIARALTNTLSGPLSFDGRDPKHPHIGANSPIPNPMSIPPQKMHSNEQEYKQQSRRMLSFDKGIKHPHGGPNSPIPNPLSIPPQKMHSNKEEYSSRSDTNISFEGKRPQHPHGGLNSPIPNPLSIPPQKMHSNEEEYKQQSRRMLTFNKGESHPHSNQSPPIPSETSIPPKKMHDSLGDFYNEDTKRIVDGKRKEIYEGRNPPNSLYEQSQLMANNNMPPQQGVTYPGNNRQIRNISRDEIYGGAQLPPTPSDVNTKPPQGVIDTPIFSNGYNLGNIYSDGTADLLGGGRYTNFVSPTPTFLRSFDVFAIANWLRNISREFGILPKQNNDPFNPPGKVERTAQSITKGLTWAASQFYLASLNPGVPEYGGITNQLWNPLSLAASSIPLMRPDGVGVGVTARAAVGGFKGANDAIEGAFWNDIYKEKQSVDTISKYSIPGLNPEEGKRFSDLLNEPFQPQITPFIDALSDRRFDGTNIPYSSTPNNLSARFIGQTIAEKDGVFEQPLNEDETYVPLMFQDLRDQPAKYMYFRAFIKEGLSENFTPEWQVRKYYGRVEGIPTYSHTTRTINLSFDVVAFGPADLPVIWKKIHKLQSMVYPAFDQGGYISSAPIIRMRLGNLIDSSNNRGLPGYINSLNFSYPDGVWTVESNWKIPRMITVSINFTTLHDNNIGVIFDENDSTTRFGTIEKLENVPQGGQNYAVDAGNVRSVLNSVEEYYRKIDVSIPGVTF